jgi:hypothetical protein
VFDTMDSLGDVQRKNDGKKRFGAAEKNVLSVLLLVVYIFRTRTQLAHN